MDLGIDNKKALVMGSSAGLGKAIALSLVQEGADVVISSRSEEKLKKTREEINASGYHVCDLTNAESRSQLVHSIQAKHKNIDILVLNTGGPPKGHFLDLDIAAWEQQSQNLWMSSIDLIREFLPAMIEKRWGRIVIVTSISAKEPVIELTLSNAYRAGLLGLCKSISREVAKHNVTVNAVLPGYIETQRLKDLGRDLNVLSETIPAGRIGQPHELGELVSFLVSERASYITGQAIACDGGYLKGI